MKEGHNTESVMKRTRFSEARIAFILKQAEEGNIGSV